MARYEGAGPDGVDSLLQLAMSSGKLWKNSSLLRPKNWLKHQC